MKTKLIIFVTFLIFTSSGCSSRFANSEMGKSITPEELSSLLTPQLLSSKATKLADHVVKRGKKSKCCLKDGCEPCFVLSSITSGKMPKKKWKKFLIFYQVAVITKNESRTLVIVLNDDTYRGEDYEDFYSYGHSEEILIDKQINGIIDVHKLSMEKDGEEIFSDAVETAPEVYWNYLVLISEKFHVR